jgi:hypothetical protein
VESESVRALRKFDNYGVLSALGSVILGKLGAQPPGLHPHQRIQMRIEIRRASKDLSCNLIFLERDPGMFERVVRQIPHQFAKRLGAVQGVAIHEPVNLDEAELRVGYMTCHTHLTEGNRVFLPHATKRVTGT